MEVFKFPKKSYYLTQGFGANTFSHKNRKAIDVSARGGYKEIYAPFSGYVSKIYVKRNNSYTIWLTSNEKVLCADGIARFAVVMMTHPNKIINYKVGQKFNQGDYLFDDGTTGNVKAHLDLEIAVYDNQNSVVNNWQSIRGDWGLVNAVDPTKYMVMDDNVIIINDFYSQQNKRYIFKKVSEISKSEEYIKGDYKTLYNMYVRTGPGTNFRIKKVSELTKNGRENSLYKNMNSSALYKKETVFTALEIINNGSSFWAKTPSGYICLKDLNGIYVEKL